MINCFKALLSISISTISATPRAATMDYDEKKAAHDRFMVRVQVE
jgi:hypothetical protein